MRLKQNLSLREVERKSRKKISNAFVSRLENGYEDGPTPETLRALSKGLKVKYLKLMVLAGYIKHSDLRGGV